MKTVNTNLEYKIVVVGSGGVGKSALTVQYCFNHFLEAYDPTIEDQHTKQTMIDNEVAYLEITDTAGQEEYSAMRPTYFRSGEGFILVYSITDRGSFENVVALYEEILRTKDSDSEPGVLVGNKLDLEKQRVVSTDEGADLAKSIGLDFVEVSVKKLVNNQEPFLRVVRAIRNMRAKKNPQTQQMAEKKKKRFRISKKGCSMF